MCIRGTAVSELPEYFVCVVSVLYAECQEAIAPNIWRRLPGLAPFAAWIVNFYLLNFILPTGCNDGGKHFCYPARAD